MKPVVTRSERAEKIIRHLAVTVDLDEGSAVGRELIRLYDFAIHHLEEATKEHDSAKVRQTKSIIEQIYLGYLEIEIRQDAEDYFERTRR